MEGLAIVIGQCINWIIGGEDETQYGTGHHEQQSIIVVDIIVSVHVADRVDDGHQEGEDDDESEEYAQSVDLVTDTDSPSQGQIEG